MKRPAYRRESLRRGILHFGVGNFHRSHQALYVEELIENASLDWGIRGVGILPTDRALHDALASQDCLYTLVERSSERSSARVIGSIVTHVYAPANPELVFEAVASPETELVSLTITEGGYYADASTGLDFEHPNVQSDLRSERGPRTVYGYLAEGLERRRLRRLGPLTLLSCDNLTDNGRVLQRGLVDFASARNLELGKWIDEVVRFPSSMVDRITPAASDAGRRYLESNFGIDDDCSVTAEPFRQWVIEDAFATARPAFERVGVELTHDVRPYQETKIRLLNAAHSAMGYLGYLCGHRYVHEAAADPTFQAYVRGLMDDEVTPLLRPLPGLPLESYKQALMVRFSNRALVDPLLRICADGSAKIPKFVMPSIRDELARNGPIHKLCLCVASWLRFLDGVDEQGRLIPIQDAGAERVAALVRRNKPDPRPALGVSEIFGRTAESPRFTSAVASLLRALYEKGARSVLSS